jgi:Putative Actinobacterial Holin-X, holin superfamily III
MPTHVTDQRDATLGSAAKEVAEHASALVRLEIELAKLEVGRKVQSLGIGVGLGAGAALFALYAVGFLFATIAAGLATVVDVWLALLIVTLFLLIATGILGLLAVNRIQKGAPPLPEQAIEEAKLTTEALKSDGSSG